MIGRDVGRRGQIWKCVHVFYLVSRRPQRRLRVAKVQAESYHKRLDMLERSVKSWLYVIEDDRATTLGEVAIVSIEACNDYKLFEINSNYLHFFILQLFSEIYLTSVATEVFEKPTQDGI